MTGRVNAMVPVPAGAARLTVPLWPAPERLVQRCPENGHPDCGCAANDQPPAAQPRGRFGADFATLPVHAHGGPLAVSRPGNRFEQEAERTAQAIVAEEARPAEVHDPRPTVARSVDPGTAPRVAPQTALVGLGAGRPLPDGERQVFERHFGRDLSAIRVHTDRAAGDLAHRIGAHAFTAGTDIVFAAGQYRPGAGDGRLLLAHELTHVVQQTGGAPGWSRVTGSVQRACAPAPCPLLSQEVFLPSPVWKQAELCMQETYAETHPASVRGLSLGFNRDWIGLAGGTPAEREALACLRPNFTAKSGMFAGEPDIWDFNNTTMYEITTESGRAFRVGKLAAELALANELTAPAECGGLLFTPGGWVPPGSCYWIGGDLFISVRNDRGVLVYRVYKDLSKEVALAAALAALAVAIKKFGGAAGLRALGAKVGGRAVPPYAVASLAAGIILLASGKAEAKLGPGSEEPIAQLFQAMSAKGTPVPPEVQELIESNPALKAKLEQAMKQGGDPTGAQKQLSQEMLDIIQANKDKFSAEDLELLLDTTGAVADKLPQGKQTFDTVRKMLDEKRAGKGGGQPTAGPAPTAQTPKAEPKGPGAEGKGSGAASKAPPTAPVSAETQDRIAAAKAPVRKLWEAVSGPGQGPPVTDETARRFFGEIPADLTDEQVNTLVTRLGPVAGESFDEILGQLKKAIADLRKRPDAPDAEAGAEPEGKSLGAGGGGAAAADPDLIKKLAAEAATIDPKRYRLGQLQLAWQAEKGDVFEGTVRGRSAAGRAVAGRVKVHIDKRLAGGKLGVTYLSATPVVDSAGNIVLTAAQLAELKTWTLITARQTK
jgi:hypothetical protein